MHDKQTLLIILNQTEANRNTSLVPNRTQTMDSSQPQTSSSRHDIMQQIASQAASVRQTFEKNKRKRAVSSATAAAAQHMAQLNRKRKFEDNLRSTAATTSSNSTDDQQHQHSQQQQHQTRGPTPTEQYLWKQTSRNFHSAIAAYGYTRPENGMQQQMAIVPTQQQQAQAPARPRVSDGIVLKSNPQDITVSYNDVVCGTGKTTSSLVGNQRYKVWVNLHKETFTKALYENVRREVACSIVNAVQGSVPAGRFLSLDIHTGLWYDIGYDRAVAITLETLMAETGTMMMNGANAVKAGTYTQPGVAKKASVQRVYVSKAA